MNFEVSREFCFSHFFLQIEERERESGGSELIVERKISEVPILPQYDKQKLPRKWV